MKKQSDSTKRPKFIQNVLWVLSINFKEVPFLAVARLIGLFNSYGSRLLSSFVIGLVIDWSIQFAKDPANNQKYVMYSILAFSGYYLLTNFASIIRNYGENLIGYHISYVIPQALLHKKLSTLSTATLEDPEIQNHINRYQENSHTLDTASRSLFILFGLSFGLILAIGPLIKIIPLTVILLIIFSIPVFFTNKNIFAKLWQLDKDITVKNRKGSALVGLLTHPESLKEIKLLNAYVYIRSYFDDYVNTYTTAKRKIYNLWSILDVVNSIVRGTVVLFGIYQIIQLAGSGKISVGQIAFYVAAITIVSDQIDGFTSNFSNFMGTNLRLTEVRELLDYEEVIKPGEQILPKLAAPPSIILNNVSFKYPGSEKFVIRDLNLEIKPGEKIAIVGENGAGKSTLIKLISNIYPVTEGEILINGQKLSDLNPDSWFQNLGVLYQDFNAYSHLSVLENIALGRISEEVNMQEVEISTINSDSKEFISEFKNGYDQILSEKYEDGTRPSSGQWQKIAIARFFYRNAPVLILDEPTSAIDPVAESNIFERIYSFVENKTVIIISHKFSTVRNADRIIVFDNGQVIEDGSHAELLALNGKYATAFNIQAKGYKD